MTNDHSGRLRQQGARPVSSEFSQSDSERDADYADVEAYLSPAPPGGRSTQIEAARRLDARSVASGQLSVEEFTDAWQCDPHEILAPGDNRHPVSSLYRGEIGTGPGYERYETGPHVANTSGPIHVDQEKGVRGSAQHSASAID